MKKHWNILYGMTLAIFTIFVLLKVFVLPSKGNVKVETAGIYSESENIEVTNYKQSSVFLEFYGL